MSVEGCRPKCRGKSIFNCLPAFILDSLSVLTERATPAVSLQFQIAHYIAPNVQPLSNCYLFPYSGTGGLNFGPEIIDLILNMIHTLVVVVEFPVFCEALLAQSTTTTI